MAELKNNNHEMFCREFIKHRNKTKAYKAVYKTKSDNTAAVSAKRLLRNDKILARIEELQAPIKQKLQIDAEWILENLKRVFEKSMSDIAVKDHEGKEIGEYRFDSTGANKSLDQMAKIIGAYENKEDAKTDDNVILKAFAESLAGVYVKKPE